MKFLIDRCAGRRLAEWLRSEGHDVVESREREPDPGDAALLDWAVSEGRVLVTLDSDFASLVLLGKAAHKGIIRLPDVPVGLRIAMLTQILADHGAEELSRTIVTVRGNRIRLSTG